MELFGIDIQSAATVTLAIGFAASIGSSFLKRWVMPRFGSIGVHVVTFLLALIGAWLFMYGRHIESFWSLAVQAFNMFAVAVALYEVLLKRFDVLKVNTPAVQAARAEERE